jgi:ribonucleotide monophosphatase NagD (HAD superfamily)
LNLEPEEALVIGDDLETDIVGAINTGIKGILVKTGKGQYYDPKTSKIKPLMVIKSISKLSELSK